MRPRSHAAKRGSVNGSFRLLHQPVERVAQLRLARHRIIDEARHHRLRGLTGA
jgi:hypothetical protein